jgi:formylglycine-generating enzyme
MLKPYSGKVFVLIAIAALVFTGVREWRRNRKMAIEFLASESASAIPTRMNTNLPAGNAPEGMVWIPGGEFSMGIGDVADICGADEPTHDAKPVHRVYVDGFWMDAKEVTNAQFKKFVDATGYVTVAERKPRAEDFPNAPADLLVPGALVFSPPDKPVSLKNPSAWWRYVPGANWKYPGGPESSIEGRENFPVVQVAYEDAVACAKWAGKRLPTEAEWEFAARGGVSGGAFTWGAELKPGGRWEANIWEGNFPNRNTAEDGFAGLAPVGSFHPNQFGLYDMTGNVWEWCADWYADDFYKNSPRENPLGAGNGTERVIRGGSWMCAENFCTNYRVAARSHATPDSGLNNLGFRCVRDKD